MSKHYLDPKASLGVKPAAERNVERITHCCLDVNAKGATIVKARGGGAWWMIWGIVLCTIPTIPLFFYNNDVQQATVSYLGFVTLFLIGLGLSLYVWPIRVWKRHLPMRFSRKTRKVYFHWKGTTYIEDWDTLRAHLSVQSGLTGVGAPIRDPHVNIEFQIEGSKPWTVFLMGTDHSGLTVDEEAAVFWEYIRQYMEDGPDNLPMPDLDIWNPVKFKDLIKVYSPFPVIRNPNPWFWPLHIFVFFPLRIVWGLICYPTEVVYYYVTKDLKVAPFPPEMEEACQCESDEVIYTLTNGISK